MGNFTAKDVKVFVPAKDFTTSKAFYIALGWKVNWDDGAGLAEMELGNCRFLLQDYYVKDWADNFVMQITVDNAQAWYEHISSVLLGQTFPGARVRIPKREPFGAVVTHVWDPSGVCLYFVQYDL